ncbi:ATP-binding protein [Aquimarina sp. AU474]|uniref:tetratricopeptide repeat-containing sensor histidine kinase n=1 Tax=Aquimarina sp. AU474 TaxID=2108529 RepID=UPI000D69C546|nr:ATP-binding protein [Aquimarina sp. AU474]
MKRYPFTSLFFLIILFILLNYSCKKDYYLNTTDSTEFLRKIDSLNAYYEIASNRANSEEEKFLAVDNFINGADSLSVDSLIYKGLNLKSTILSRSNNYLKAIEQANLMIDLARKKSDSENLGKAYYKVGYLHKEKGDYIESFKDYNQSFKIFRNLKDSIRAGKCLMALSRVQRILGDHNAGKTTATDGLRYLENSTEYRTISGLYHGISISFIELKNSKEALIWNNKALNLIKDSIAKNKIGARNILTYKNTRANILSREKRYEESINILQALLKESDSLQKPTEYAQLLSNLGYIKFLQNPKNIMSELMLLKARSIRHEKEDLFGLFASNIHLTKYFKNKDVEKAKYYAHQAFLCSENFEDYEASMEVLTLITELEPNSLEYHQHFKDASLQLMELRKKTREIYAPTRFENENLLKQNEEKNRKIHIVRNQNTIYLLGMAVLFLGIAFAIYFFRQRTKYLAQQNQIIQFQASYETETRISKRLHDELGNDIFQVMLQYQNDPHDPQIKDKLNTTYHKARDISRENNEFDTDETFIEELSNMLQNYSKNGIQLMVRGLDKIDWDLKEKPVKITVYRVLQELMTNMQKHSNASLVVLVFSNVDQMMMIKYSDNGIGISKEDLKSKNGLRNTEKRIGAIGGTLIFESEKEKGFKAEIKIPN